MDKESRIYVAGHGGLVGSAISGSLERKGYVNMIYRTIDELDLRRQSDTEAFFDRERPEYVFLAAAKVGGILANNTYKAEFIYDNITIVTNVIQAAYKCGVKKLLNLGSSCIYPKLAPQPLKEEYLLTDKLEPTNEPYAIAKIGAIKLCRYYNEQYGTNFISVMPTNLYGPNETFNLETSHVIPSLIRKFHLAKLLRNGDHEGVKADILRFPLGFGCDAGMDLDDRAMVGKTLGDMGITADHVALWGSGEPYREFLYVEDLAEACIFLMENYDYEDIGEFINIGTGKDLKIRELARIIRKTVGFDGDIIWDNVKPDGTPRKVLDISRIRSLGWEPDVSLEKGIAMTYDWFTGTEPPVQEDSFSEVRGSEGPGQEKGPAR